MPAHRIPDVLAVLQPTTTGVVNATSEHPLIEDKMREMQAELSKVYESHHEELILRSERPGAWGARDTNRES